MNSERIYVDFETQPIYEIAATVMSALLYSQPSDTEDDREKALTALCARALRMRAESDGKWAQEYLPIKPCYAVQSVEETDRVLKDVNRRMRDRMTAGRIALPFLQYAHSGELPVIDKRRTKPTVNKLAEFVLPETGGGDVENLKSRVWSPSRPVLHLAAAFEFARYVLAKGDVALGYGTILWDEAFVRFVLRVAEDLESLVAKSFDSGNLRFDPSTLIRIRVVEKKSRSKTGSVSDSDLSVPLSDVCANGTGSTNHKVAGA